jgi:hypothetical protein
VTITSLVSAACLRVGGQQLSKYVCAHHIGRSLVHAANDTAALRPERDLGSNPAACYSFHRACEPCIFLGISPRCPLNKGKGLEAILLEQTIPATFHWPGPKFHFRNLQAACFFPWAGILTSPRTLFELAVRPWQAARSPQPTEPVDRNTGIFHVAGVHWGNWK